MLILRLATIAVVASILSACSSIVPETTTPGITYGSLLFKENVYAKDMFGNPFTVTAGTILTSDRKFENKLIYCGLIVYHAVAQHRCASFDGKTLIVNEGTDFKPASTDVRPGVIEIRTAR